MKSLCSILLLALWPLLAPAEEIDPRALPKTIDDLAKSFVQLGLAFGQHDADYVDAYYGPAEWKTKADSEKLTVDALHEQALDLFTDLSQVRFPALEFEQARLANLLRNVSALETRMRIVSGQHPNFDEESRALYDAVAPTFPEAHFQKTLGQLEKKIPGKGPLVQRYDAWRKPFMIPKDKLDAVFQLAIKACRERTLAQIKLPPNESFTVEYVTDKPWGGYNWYKGEYRSVIQVNTDLPSYIDRAIDLAAHEGYPGHHVYNSLLEKNLVRERNWTEFFLNPLFAPQSLIAEGTANFGREVVFTPPERKKFETETLWPAAGIDPKRYDEFYAVQDLTRDLSYAVNEAARKLIDGEIDTNAASAWLQKYALMDEKRAQKRVEFIQRYRSYVINYNVGEDLVRHYVEKQGGTPAQPEKRWRAFEQLLLTPRLPSSLQ